MFDPHTFFGREATLTDEEIEMTDVRRTLHQQRVNEFMAKAGQEVPAHPCIPDEKVRLLRARLILEEAMETILALGIDLNVRYTGVGAGGEIPVTKKSIRFDVNPTRQPDLIEIADGCADISVVTTGTLSACGIADLPLLEEVDRSNLDKFRGDAHRCPDTGKWIKPTDWTAPDIVQVLINQGAEVCTVTK